MNDRDIVTHSNVSLKPDAARTVIRPFAVGDAAGFAIAGHPRGQRIAERILSLDEAQIAEAFETVRASLDERHRNVETILLRRFGEVKAATIGDRAVSHEQALLIGAYFSEEYSFEAAALFNPSMVLHPDQSGVAEGSIRFILSLRCIGEGHVSSVTFRTGTWAPGGEIAVDEPSRWAVAPHIETRTDADEDVRINLRCAGSQDVSETVIFPLTPSQKQGIEDVRLVQFVEEDGSAVYLGTYTAFSGVEVREELLRTSDFSAFEMRPLTGSVAASKGMALFPRRVGGRYMALGRQDNENLWLIASDDLYRWDGGEKIVGPRFPWEFIQIGNCGSPIEIDEGWLVLTHGVGTVRNYCIGACLLDKDDPARLLARTPRPLMAPNPQERDGYVPNVVYSCGGLVHDRTLILPYGVADSFATFATVAIDDLLAEMA
jgi:predicted GH43/DUF377 family glycosyl hydrolase